VAAVQRDTDFDLEAVETAVKAAVLSVGARLLEDLVNTVGVGQRKKPVLCTCGAAMKSRGRKPKSLLTLMGPVQYRRSLFQCPACRATRFPGDELLNVANTSRSPAVQRQVARLGAKEPFEEVSKDLAALAGIRLCRKEAERISERTGRAMESWQEKERTALRFAEPPPPEAEKTIDTLYIEFDGTGVPMVPGEVAGRKGKQEDGSAKTREAKLGCVFTQHDFDEQGRPVRDAASTSFVGAIESAAQFGQRIFGEAVRRGLFQAKRVVVLGDGAEWVKNLAGHHFGHGQFIIDFYHAKEHVAELCRALFGRDLKRLNRYRDTWWERLYEGDIESILQEARALLPKDPRAKKDARTQVRYFEKNIPHMRYGRFRREGLFIGSGVIEAACKNLIGHRLKQSGMEWTVQGANDIIALRCTELSNRTQAFWANKAA
jgi:hypothetical protein